MLFGRDRRSARVIDKQVEILQEIAANPVWEEDDREIIYTQIEELQGVVGALYMKHELTDNQKDVLEKALIQANYLGV